MLKESDGEVACEWGLMSGWWRSHGKDLVGWKMWRDLVQNPRSLDGDSECGRVKEEDCDWGCYNGVKGATNRRVEEGYGAGIHGRCTAGTGRLVDRVRIVEGV